MSDTVPREAEAESKTSLAPNADLPLLETDTCWREYLDVDTAAENPHTKELYAFWKSVCPAQGGLPAAEALDPVALPRACLPYLILLDIERDPLVFRYRLTGTMIDHVQNRNLSGTTVDQHEPVAMRRLLVEDLTHMVETGTPHYTRLFFKNATGHLRHVSALRMPFADVAGGSKVVRCLVLLEFHEE